MFARPCLVVSKCMSITSPDLLGEPTGPQPTPPHVPQQFHENPWATITIEATAWVQVTTRIRPGRRDFVYVHPNGTYRYGGRLIDSQQRALAYQRSLSPDTPATPASAPSDAQHDLAAQPAPSAPSQDNMLDLSVSDLIDFSIGEHTQDEGGNETQRLFSSQASSQAGGGESKEFQTPLPENSIPTQGEQNQICGAVLSSSVLPPSDESMSGLWLTSNPLYITGIIEQISDVCSNVFGPFKKSKLTNYTRTFRLLGSDEFNKIAGLYIPADLLKDIELQVRSRDSEHPMHLILERIAKAIYIKRICFKSVYTPKQKKKFVGDTTCSICWNDVGDEKTTLTACGHNFCLKCIHTWIKKGNQLCPNCRKPVTPKQVDQFNGMLF